jgi:hypothetical protein
MCFPWSRRLPRRLHCRYLGRGEQDGAHNQRFTASRSTSTAPTDAERRFRMGALTGDPGHVHHALRFVRPAQGSPPPRRGHQVAPGASHSPGREVRLSRAACAIKAASVIPLMSAREKKMNWRRAQNSTILWKSALSATMLIANVSRSPLPTDLVSSIGAPFSKYVMR